MNILFEDEFLIVAVKPVGIPSQSDGVEDFTEAVKKYVNASGLHIINRLDQPVGGIVLFAKDKKTAELLSETDITKHYLTVVCGVPKAGDRLENYLMHNKRVNVTKVVNKGMGKLAVLEYNKLWQKEDMALLKVKLITGRHHQIRVQMQANGTPIYGDCKYNPQFKHKRGVYPALFSHSLSFVHPITKEKISCEVYPEDEIYSRTT